MTTEKRVQLESSARRLSDILNDAAAGMSDAERAEAERKLQEIAADIERRQSN